MPKCETCGNEYDKAFQVVKDGKSHTFDSFECAIAAAGHGLAGAGSAVNWTDSRKASKAACCSRTRSAGPLILMNQTCSPRVTTATRIRRGLSPSPVRSTR